MLFFRLQGTAEPVEDLMLLRRVQLDRVGVALGGGVVSPPSTGRCDGVLQLSGTDDFVTPLGALGVVVEHPVERRLGKHQHRPRKSKRRTR